MNPYTSTNLVADQDGHTPGAFTLLELVTSLVILSILMIGMMSAVRIASRALDNGTGASQRTNQTAQVIEQVVSDLGGAISFSEQTDRAVTFTVSDRDGDATEETIRYAWSGDAGDPLTLAYNGQQAVAIAPDVRQFNLTYLLKIVEPAIVTGGEAVLIYHDDVPGGGLFTHAINKNKAFAIYFKPTLPADTESWAVTRIKLMAKKVKGGSGDGVMNVKVTTTDADGKPTGTVLDQTTLNESSLSTDYNWIDIPFNSLDSLDPNQGYAVVIEYVSGKGSIAHFQGEVNGSTMTSDTHYLKSTGSKKGWSEPDNKKDMRFHLFGEVTQNNP